MIWQYASSSPFSYLPLQFPVGNNSYFYLFIHTRVGRDSSVGIATRYRLDGPGSNPGGGEIFCPTYSMGTGSFPGIKWPGRGVDQPSSSRAEVKERVELYLYSPSWPSWCVLEWTLPLPLPLPALIILASEWCFLLQTSYIFFAPAVYSSFMSSVSHIISIYFVWIFQLLQFC